MKKQCKTIIIVALVVIALILIVTYLIKPHNFVPKDAPFEKGEEPIRYTWKDMGDGLWKRNDLECDAFTDYLCLSNCYEYVPDCILDYTERNITSMGNEVFCLTQGCGFDGCDIVCPTG